MGLGYEIITHVDFTQQGTVSVLITDLPPVKFFVKVQLQADLSIVIRFFKLMFILNMLTDTWEN